jgi:hypothetical protein
MNVIKPIEHVPQVVSNTTSGIENRYSGFNAGRRMGKSMLKQLYYGNFSVQQSSKFMILDQATVDGDQWYTVSCTKEVSAWITTQPKDMFQEHINDTWHFALGKFDMHEKLYTMLALKWS